MAVALLVSAWIETQYVTFIIYNCNVALLVSAWIETFDDGISVQEYVVALLVSAWIETSGHYGNLETGKRRTPRECVD